MAPPRCRQNSPILPRRSRPTTACRSRSAASRWGQTIAPVVQGIGQIGSALNGIAAGLAGLNAAQKARVQQFAAELPERLATFLLLEWLDGLAPELPKSLALAGIVDRIEERGDPADLTKPPYVRRAVRLDRLGPLLSDPVGYMETLYGFGTPGFDGLELFRRIKALIDRPSAEAALITPPGQPAILDAYFFRLAVDQPAGDVPGLSLRLRRAAVADVSGRDPVDGAVEGDREYHQPLRRRARGEDQAARLDLVRAADRQRKRRLRLRR